MTFLNNWYEEIINQRAMKDLTARQDAFKIDRERPSAFFLNLEKQVKKENYIPRLREGDRWITEQTEIDKKITEYYEDLYDNKDNLRSGIDIGTYLPPAGVGIAPTLEEDQRLRLEGGIRKQEV